MLEEAKEAVGQVSPSLATTKAMAENFCLNPVTWVALSAIAYATYVTGKKAHDYFTKPAPIKDRDGLLTSAMNTVSKNISHAFGTEINDHIYTDGTRYTKLCNKRAELSKKLSTLLGKSTTNATHPPEWELDDDYRPIMLYDFQSK